MARQVRRWHGTAVAALGLTLLAGCLQSNPRAAPLLPLPNACEAPVTLRASQAADVQVAMGRALEKRGATEQAQTVYLEALKHDPSRADACARLAVLYDRQGKFKESEEVYRKALSAMPDNADLLTNRGYSLYLQSRWEEAEAALRHALALAPDHRRAHNNLGLVLAQLGRDEDALASFRSAGCTEADAHVNLAFVFTLRRRWPEARGHYERALALEPASAPARVGLRQLDDLVAKAAAGPPARLAAPVLSAETAGPSPLQDSGG